MTATNTRFPCEGSPRSSPYSDGPHAEEGKSQWVTAWHGCKLEALFSIMHHGKLRASSDKEGRGERYHPHAPGIYCHEGKTQDKVWNYARFVPLFRDEFFLGCNVGAEGGYTCEPFHRRTGPTESKRMFMFMFQPCSKRCIGKVKGQRTSNGIFRKVITQFTHCMKRHLDFFA